MARTQLSPLLCDATHSGQLRPWCWLVSIDNPEVPAADRPASLAGCSLGWVGEDAGELGLGYMDHSGHSG